MEARVVDGGTAELPDELDAIGWVTADGSDGTSTPNRGDIVIATPSCGIRAP